MGKKKGRNITFLQRETLEQEAQLDSDDEPGGLHIGSAVIYRAPLSSRKTARLPSSSRQRRTCTSCVDTATASTSQVQHNLSNLSFDKSDDSLDEELRDYLDNLKQHEDDEGSDSPATDKEASPSIPGGTTATPTVSTPAWVEKDDDDDNAECSSRPGLGYHPGLGFHSTTAAARFADVGLDDALEGLLQQDLAAGVYHASDTDTGSSDTLSDNSSSSSDADDADAAAHPLQSLDVQDLDAFTAVVVDTEGRPMAVWEQLPVQQRFPVQTRQGTGATQLAGSTRISRKQQTAKQRIATRNANTSAAAVLASSIRIPSFRDPDIAAAAQAACQAAATAAEASAADRARERKQQRSVIKGAAGGQLLPGEKKKLRREKITAKRAVRQSERGVSALDVLAAVEDFVAAEGDMTILPPAGKHKQAFIRALAALYGIKATSKGGSSSSSGKSSLVLYSTPTTAAIDDGDGVKMHQLRQLLTAELTREMSDAAVAAGPAPGSVGKQQQQHHKSPQQQQGSSRRDIRAAAGSSESIFQQPVAFVSAGVIQPDSDLQQAVTAAEAATQHECVDIQELTAAEAATLGGNVEGLGHRDVAAALSMRSAASAEGVADIPVEHLDAVNEQTSLQQQQQQQHKTQLPPGGWVVDTQPCSSAVASVGQPLSTITTAEKDIMYDRALGLGLGYGVTQGLGFGGHDISGADDHDDDHDDDHQIDGSDEDHGVDRSLGDVSAAASTVVPQSSRRGNSSSSSSADRVLQELERKFSNLRAVTNPHAARRQQRQQRRQQYEQRLRNPNTALGPDTSNAVLSAAAAAAARDSSSGEDAGAGMGSLTLGMTAQQVKKAKKQQLRNQRRQARLAAADEHSDPAAAAAGSSVSNVSHSFAGFEVHTTGIGSRLLSGWGWREGEGLGRARQGRAEPLQAARRPRQLGLGAE